MFYNIGKHIKNNKIVYRLNDETFLKLKELNIAAKRRGCRAGVNKARNIDISSTNRQIHQKARTVNLCNLQGVPKQNLRSPSTRYAVWNARSMKAPAKAPSIIDFVISNKLDILAIVESWLKTDHAKTKRLLSDLEKALPDHEFHHIPRLTRGGGVGVLLRKGFKINVNTPSIFRSFEHIDLTVSSNSSAVRLLTIYRPPPSKANKLNSGLFFTEFSTLVESVSTLTTPVVIGGDFNIHMDVPDDRDAITMKDLLESSSLQQHVLVPTHKDGHLLDLLITKTSDSIVSDIKVDESLPSDHAAVKCRVNMSRPPATKQTVTFRKLREIQIDNFKEDIIASSVVTDPEDNIESLCRQFDTVMSGILERHAPEQTKCITLRPHAPWYSDELRAAKREKRRCERQYVKSGLTVHKQIFRAACDDYKDLLETAKTNYHKSKLSNLDSRQLFREVDKLCSSNTSKILPSHDSEEKLANDFANFFRDKIERVKDKLDNISRPDSIPETPLHQSTFCKFAIVSEEEVRNIVMKAPSSSCQADCIPTWLLKRAFQSFCHASLRSSICRFNQERFHPPIKLRV